MEHRWRSFLTSIGCLFTLLITIGIEGCTGPRAVLANLPPTQNPAKTATVELSVTLAPGGTVSTPQGTPRPSPAVKAEGEITEITPAPAFPTPTPGQPACLSGTGRFEQGQITSSLLPHPMHYRVYLPPCFQDLTGQRYPVLYMLHGLNAGDDQWERMGIGVTADALIAAGQIEPLIIVMPEDNDSLQPTQSHFGQALVEELVPWIDSHYPTRTDRLGRAIGGLSRGAAWAIHIGLTDWRLFGAIGAHSLALFWTDGEEINQLLGSIPWDGLPKIYMDIGTKDLDLESTTSFEERLMALHIPHEWHLFPGFHDEDYWKSHLEDYLRWYSAQW